MNMSFNMKISQSRLMGSESSHHIQMTYGTVSLPMIRNVHQLLISGDERCDETQVLDIGRCGLTTSQAEGIKAPRVYIMSEHNR